MLLSMQVHPKIVQEILGHSQINITMDIYSHVLPTMQEEAMGKVNEVLRKH
jgi:integrase